ncbi:MAG: class I SAM-dependent methyltransferase [bacterium]
MRKEKNPLFLRRYYDAVKDRCSFRALASQVVRADMRVLDAGCGKRSVIGECNLQTKFTLGIEVRYEDLRENSAVDFRTVGNIEHLPLKGKVCDCIVCRNVVEHLEDPVQVFREFERVLGDGGLLLVRTPNIHNPLMFLSALLPLRLRVWMKHRLLHDTQGDTFPTRYKCNSLKKLAGTLKRLDMEPEFVGRDGLLAYFNFSSLLLTLVTVYEKVTDIPFLRWLKMWIVVSFRKAGAPPQ